MEYRLRVSLGRRVNVGASSVLGTRSEDVTEPRARAKEKSRELGRKVDLAILREALQLSQQKLAKKIGINQPEVAKIEKRSDMLLSTLGKVLSAMGANLRIIAIFPDHDIEIQSLSKIAARPRSGPRSRSNRIRPTRRIAARKGVAAG